MTTPQEKMAFSGTKHGSKTMQAVEWRGKQSVAVNNQRPAPIVTDPEDVIIRVTSTAICGSDLHLYVGAMPGMKSGDVLGHEFMGRVEAMGPAVTGLEVGQRVVASFEMGCGRCLYCHRELFSCCDNTNPSEEQEALYGHRTAGFHGYSHMTVEGELQQEAATLRPSAPLQATYARIPFANLNAIKVPDSLSDEKVLFLSDILPTAWHATELGEVSEGDTVAIWGAGPVGILAAHCAMYRKAAKVVIIDREAYRLEFAAQKVPGVVTLNAAELPKGGVKAELSRLIHHGPDVVIEAVGFHYTTSLLHKAQMAVGLETDPSEMLNEMITCCAKGGRISIVGVYAGTTNQFNIGALMEKQLTLRGGQTPVQRYWKKLLELIEAGKLTPDMVITHQLPIAEAPKGYKMFNDKTDGCIKVVLKP